MALDGCSVVEPGGLRDSTKVNGFEPVDRWTCELYAYFRAVVRTGTRRSNVMKHNVGDAPRSFY